MCGADSGASIKLMRKLPKIFLVGSIALFAVSLTAEGSAVHYGLFKPVSALLFIAWFITHLVSRLDPEQYAADQRLRDELLHEPRAAEPLRLRAVADVAA